MGNIVAQISPHSLCESCYPDVIPMGAIFLSLIDLFPL